MAKKLAKLSLRENKLAEGAAWAVATRSFREEAVGDNKDGFVATTRTWRLTMRRTMARSRIYVED